LAKSFPRNIGRRQRHPGALVHLADDNEQESGSAKYGQPQHPAMLPLCHKQSFELTQFLSHLRPIALPPTPYRGVGNIDDRSTGGFSFG
jgi:hypothetical protein